MSLRDEIAAEIEGWRSVGGYDDHLPDHLADWFGARIAELEAERDRYEYMEAAMLNAESKVRPDDVVVIDGKWWRYDPDEAVQWGSSDGTDSGIDCTLVPVEDTDEG